MFPICLCVEKKTYFIIYTLLCPQNVRELWGEFQRFLSD